MHKFSAINGRHMQYHVPFLKGCFVIIVSNYNEVISYNHKAK